MSKKYAIEEELEGLQILSDKTAEFTGVAYDWVSTLKEHNLLDRLYEFTRSIDAHREKLKKQLEEAIKEEEEEDNV